MDSDLIEDLENVSQNCLPSKSIEILKRATLCVLKGGLCNEDTYIVLPDNNVFIFPSTQLPEVWLNILHIYCFKDYVLNSEFIPRPGWVVIDAGAYLGLYTLFAAKLMGSKGRVYAIEPNPLSIKYLRSNIAINGLEDIAIVIPSALNNEDDTKNMFTTEYWGVSSLKHEYVNIYKYRFKNTRVQVRRLTTIMREFNIVHVDLLKIDIEGSENEVIDDLWRDYRYSSKIKRLVIEVHRGITNLTQITLKLRHIGFDVYIRDIGLKYQSFIYAIK